MKHAHTCVGCFLKAHRPPIDEAWTGALIAFAMFEIAGLCAEHRSDTLDIAQAAAGQRASARAALRLIRGGRREPHRRTPHRPRPERGDE